MTKEQLIIERDKLYAEYGRRAEEIKLQAQKDRTWSDWGLDSNNHLYKELNREMLQRAKDLIKRFEEEQERKK